MDRRVVVLGSCSVCHVFASPNLPNRGETVIGDDYHIVVGGKGSGQAIVACRLGSEVFMLEHLGDDAYGRREKESYREMGIHTEYVYLDKDCPPAQEAFSWTPRGRIRLLLCREPTAM